MSASDLDSEITKKEGEIAAAESKFKVLTYNKTRTTHVLKSKHMLLQGHKHVHTLIFAVRRLAMGCCLLRLTGMDVWMQAEVEKLQATYKALQETKEEAIKTVKESGLGLMKAVKAANKKK